MKRIVALVVGVALMLAVPSVALATGGSTCASYNGQTCNVASNTASRSPASTAADTANTTEAANASTASTLPFTGLDVVFLAVGGGVLLGAGLVVRRISRGLE